MGRLTSIVVVAVLVLGISSTAFVVLAKKGHFDEVIDENAARMMDEGRETFRFDTFGSEAFWGDTLRLHEAILGEELGGVGPGVSPNTALAVGLKVDVDALPKPLLNRIRQGRVDLNDPAATVELIRNDAVVGIEGIFNEDENLVSMGITCAICHSVVDDSFAPGIGRRLDGWANRDLNVGAIIALSPDLQPVVDLLRNAPDLQNLDVATLRGVFNAWGPGRFDAIVLHDGKALGPDGEPRPVLIPPAFGLAGMHLHTWTGWGSVTYWNAFVANTEMQGRGTFFDPRLNDPEKFPIDAATGRWNIRNSPDLITSKLPALHFYQLAIPAPTPPPGSFDEEAASRGEDLFNGKAECATCHVPPLYTEPGWNLHSADEIGIDDFQAKRSPDEGYRTAPLNGLWTHMKGGFYHDGRFATLLDVVNHYDAFFGLGLQENEKNDIVEFLKSLPFGLEPDGDDEDDDD